jgi:uncharacterized protein (DUF302 family)
MPRLVFAVLLLAVLSALPSAGRAVENGTRVIVSDHSYWALITRLEAAIRKQKLRILTRASVRGAARQRKLKIPANMVIGAFSEDYTARILRANVAAGIEAPIRFYITRGQDDKTTTLWYRRPSWVLAPYDNGSGDMRTLATELDGVMETIVKQATKPPVLVKRRPAKRKPAKREIAKREFIKREADTRAAVEPAADKPATDKPERRAKTALAKPVKPQPPKQATAAASKRAKAAPPKPAKPAPAKTATATSLKRAPAKTATAAPAKAKAPIPLARAAPTPLARTAPTPLKRVEAAAERRERTPQQRAKAQITKKAPKTATKTATKTVAKTRGTIELSPLMLRLQGQ